ncbi:sugar transferase [Timonella senegalensis]|uniref:sugar transferase n=1 Tax=Timonella senegalensis TaxID=1465825 RepID=UPI0002FE6775|nr:sugar transferase [Timonella senegalensis]
MAIVEKTAVSGTRTTWQRIYARRLTISDLLVIVVSVVGAQLIRFGSTSPGVELNPERGLSLTLSYYSLSLLLILGWMLALHVFDTRDSKVIGTGPLEYKLIVDTTIRVFGILAILSLVFKSDIARGYLLIAFPAGLFLLLLSRWTWRKWLHQQRKQGLFMHRTVVVGEHEKLLHVTSRVTKDSFAGFEIVAAVTSPSEYESIGTNLGPVYDYSQILDALDETGADTIILTSSDVLSPKKMRRLGWALEDRNVELVVAPALTDIAGPRIHTRPISGLPLLHIEYPKLAGRQYFSKRVFDILGSLALILVLSPVLVGVALAVKLTSPGPVMYRQERIGLNGQPFKMLKFRSMIPNADSQLAALLAQQGTADKPLFKVENDPRITPVGRFIRKYSLDELPQLFNALSGSMSLVGPRPQVEAEVALYDQWAHRRLLMKPGLTGLWQVSGRSNLDWEDAIRLDLYYVENWSMVNDLILLYRTVKTVIRPDGAH